MNYSSTAPSPGQITGPPFIALVDIDGGPVPAWERDAPVVPPPDDDDESDPTSWPSWTDADRWIVSDAIPTSVASVQLHAIEPADDDEPRPTADGPGYEPTAADWEDYAAWSQQIEARRLGLLLPISGGAPDDDERADALAYEHFLDELAEDRSREDRMTGNAWL